MSFIKSKSEQYLENKPDVPQVSALVGKVVSQYRHDTLSEQIAQGIYREGSGSNFKDGTSAAGLVASSTGIKKMGQVLSSGGGHEGLSNFRGPGDTVKQVPEVYSPLWLNSNLNLPRDRATINAWCRSFYALNPFVQNAINLHSTYPISKLNIKCPNKKVEQFFHNLVEELDLMNICCQIAQEYWLLGESFVYAELDESSGQWSRLSIQNPDYMIVNRTVVADEPVIMLRPDENLKRIIFSNRPKDIEQRKQLSQEIVNAVRRGQNIPLDNYHVSHLARRISPYEIRGTGLPVCIFRQLMLYDKLRESKYAQADNMINPLTLVKIGGEGMDALHPTVADLEAWRNVFEAAQYDKDFKIFTHAGIQVERVGYGQGIYDISGDITQLMKEIFIGLQTPPIIMDNQDTTYANGSVSLDVLRQRYLQFRNKLAAWLRTKVFAPISKIQDFYDYKDGEKKLIVPDIEWNYMSLFDAGDYINNLVNLTQGTDDQKRVSLHSLYRSLGLDYDDEIRKLRHENIQSVIFQKEKEALQAMELNELRSLDDDPEIVKPANKDGNAAPTSSQPVPGETPTSGSLPGVDLSATPPPLMPPPPASTS